MYTQCPECLTVYAIDEDALQASLGIVRCGRCDKRFDALRTLSDTLPIEPLAPLPEQEPVERAPTLTEAVPPAALESAASKLRRKKTGRAPESAPAPPPAMHTAPSGGADDWFSDLESEWAAMPAASDAGAPQADTAPDEALDAPTDQAGATAFEDEAPEPPDAPDAAVLPDAPAPEAPGTVQQVELFDETQAIVGDEAASATPSGIAADAGELEAEPAPVYVPPRRRVSRTGLAWVSGCALLACLLAAQLAWANRIELFRNPATQPWMARICGAIPCNLPLIKDTAKLELLSRDVRPNPNAAGALTITATVRNEAAFSQPWPVVLVELNDLDNKPVAMRRFRPSEYMTDPARRSAGIAPGATAVVAFEVADPGRRAVAFQFGFE